MLDVHPAPPPVRHSLLEGIRALLELQQLIIASPILSRAPKGDGHPVMTLPGFGGADGSMALLRRWLTTWGYDAHPWELGRNFPVNRVGSMKEAMAFRKKMVARAGQRVKKIHEDTGEKVSLIGWSLGGVYACQIAQEHPEWIRRVITLGTPHGDPRGTIAWNILKRVYGSETPERARDMAKWLAVSNGRKHTVPVSVIYSPCDGIVSTEVARLMNDRNVEHICVRSSHVGFGINPRVYWQIARRLAIKVPS